MRLLYDTRNVHPLDRFDHYRDGAATELAPVEVYGPVPRRLSAKMSAGPIGDFGFEELSWTADTEIVTVRNERLIRANDPEQYRLILVIDGEINLEQRNHRTRSRRGDIGLFDLSVPWRAAHPPETGPMRIAMLTFPRTLLPVDERRVRSIAGTFMPRRMPVSDLMRQLLVGLADAVEPVDYADILAECTAGLINRRLGLPDGVTPHTRRLLYLTRIREVIRANHRDPALDPVRIAGAANISSRYLHKIFEGTGSTAMQLVKELRLQECRRRLEDPALRAVAVGQIAGACGYRRPDQFARDFRQAFGLTPTQVRDAHGEAGR